MFNIGDKVVFIDTPNGTSIFQTGRTATVITTEEEQGSGLIGVKWDDCWYAHDDGLGLCSPCVLCHTSQLDPAILYYITTAYNIFKKQEIEALSSNTTPLTRSENDGT